MKLRARRFPVNPIVTPEMLPKGQGDNINGPSLIETPDWLPGRLGRFYLYFAHHAGKSIRLAYADALEGPWTVHAPGTLQLADAPGCRDHIASPDVHVDAGARRIVMYFHGPQIGRKGQRTYFAQSADGLSFAADAEPLANFYLRVVRWRDRWVGMAKGGQMYLAEAMEGPFRPLATPALPMSEPNANGPGDVRHVALAVAGDLLTVWFSRIGDAPEHILVATVDLSRPEPEWRAGPAQSVLRPELVWEGANLPVVASVSGAAHGPEHALRDPAVLVHEGRTVLVYSVAGESGLAIAELGD